MPETRFSDAEGKILTVFGDAEGKILTVTPRRSPRFLQQCQNLLKIAETSTRRSRSSPISIDTSPLKTKRKSNVGLRSGDGRSPECENMEKCNKWPRISDRLLNGRTRLSGKEEADVASHYVIEKRVTRSSGRDKDLAGGKVSDAFAEGSVEIVVELSKGGKGLGGVDLCAQREGNTEKMVTRSGSRAVALYKGSEVQNGSFWDESKLKGGVVDQHDQELGVNGTAKSKGSNMVGRRLPNVVVSDQKKRDRSAIRSKPGFEKRVARSFSRSSQTNESGLSVKKADNVEKRITRCSTRKDVVEKASSLSAETSCEVSVPEERKFEDVSRRDAQELGSSRIHEEVDLLERTRRGERRKRHQVDEEKEIGDEWTVEQELALRRAYFTVKPTPHFWKKVAKMVQGKSAEECFDKIQSDLQTPPQPRTHLRAKKKKLSPIPCSASKLLTPIETKSKKLKPRKMNVLLAQKTVRQLLQKHQEEDKHSGLDLFALLEPSANDNPSSPNIQEFDSPSPSKEENPGVLTKCRGTSDSSASKKRKSRLSILSPPVLKQIKNKALHEKYIDQLHRRDAKRKAESRRNAKHELGENDEKSNHLKENAVKAAKDALVFDALDAVNKLRSLKSDASDSPDEDDYTTDHSDEDDEQDNLP